MPRAVDGWKVCSKCRRRLPVSEFYQNRTSADGLYYQCKECERPRRREAAQRERDEYGAIPLWVNIYAFIKDWQRMSIRELSIKYLVCESSVKKWAWHLRKVGYDMPKKHRRYNYNEFAFWAQCMNTAQLMKAFGLTQNNVSKRKTRLRRKGYRFPTDSHGMIGKQNSKGKNTGPRFDRKETIEVCKQYPYYSQAAGILGIAPKTLRQRITVCRKEGLI